MAADSFGSVAAPLWSAESGSELVTSATGVTTDSVNYAVARSTLGDQYESLEYPPLNAPLVVTLLPGAVGGATLPEQAPKKEGKNLSRPHEDAPYRIYPPDRDNLDIADAERIVAFGRGAFNPEALALVEQLAEKLGAAVAGTRPAADEGWLPFSRQVGLTGAVVRPRLYVAVGISGAPYHMVGVKDPETLIAVNSDADAPIFGWADVGIVGDLKEVLPRLIMEIGDGGIIKQTGGPRAGRKGG
jgi:electron transfer flavoprotein alpha subunit